MTRALLRLEHVAAFALCLWLLLEHWAEVRLWPALLLFAYIDLIGYLPGLLASRGGRPVHRGFHVAYNATHSLLGGAAVALLWCALVRPEWALLAIPLHLCGDRGLLGNSLKPFAEPFGGKG
ncbi:hypothetical protein JOF53_006734 [Crossiella equi]|uniref:DUF4260 family protein n=1 Tax=Crossiella equi TaxID=130796 RepID=A0ABS5AMR0_9PSEU|nr:hypothetical protein [Crossiella equi]MBP2477862.1 hypothetical protein [Crossiella equi]